MLFWFGALARKRNKNKSTILNLGNETKAVFRIFNSSFFSFFFYFFFKTKNKFRMKNCSVSALLTKIFYTNKRCFQWLIGGKNFGIINRAFCNKFLFDCFSNHFFNTFRPICWISFGRLDVRKKWRRANKEKIKNDKKENFGAWQMLTLFYVQQYAIS